MQNQNNQQNKQITSQHNIKTSNRQTNLANKNPQQTKPKRQILYYNKHTNQTKQKLTHPQVIIAKHHQRTHTHKFKVNHIIKTN